MSWRTCHVWGGLVAGFRAAWTGLNLAAITAALDGDLAPRRLPTSPGTLAIFHGRHALHRVTPVEGATTRMNAVFTFGAEPDMCLTARTQQLFYGRRVAAATSR